MVNNETQSRFKDAQWFNPNLDVVICGLGGIGSHLNYILCRQGYKTYIYDFDTIEIHNIGSQMYSVNDLGKMKTDKAIEVAKAFGNDKYTSLGRFTKDSPIGNIVFACFDNMEARKLLFEKWVDYQLSKDKEYKTNHPGEINIFLDGRMTAESMQVYSVKTMKEIEAYKTTLFNDDEVAEAPCSYKATCQTGTMIGSLMSMIFLNHVANKMININIRETPFAIKFDNPMMYYKSYTVDEYNK